ncbi:MAG: ABC transporter permease [Thermoflexales bacterium]
MAVLDELIKQSHELWAYRSLLRMLVVRDLKARYRGSALGVLWSFLQPLGMMLVISFAFGVIRGGPASMPNFHVFVLTGLLPWNLFSTSVTIGANSVVAHGSLVKKVYFPRITLPVSTVISSTINFVLALPLWAAVAVISGHHLHASLIMLPLIVLVQLCFTIGLVLILATLQVFYRDTQFIVELSMLALFFITPIWYDVAQAQPFYLFGRAWATDVWIRRLNPMASLVNLYQDVMYWGRFTDLDFLLRTGLTALVFLLIGVLVFQRLSPRFGEEL